MQKDCRSSATRTGWSRGNEVCDDFMKLRLSSSGCETRPARGEPARSVASLATGVATRPAMRRHANVWAVGHAATKAISFQVPRVLFHLKATATSPTWARGGLHPAGSSTTAHTKRTAQEPGRPLFLLREKPVIRGAGDPSPTLDTLAGARVGGEEQAPAPR